MFIRNELRTNLLYSHNADNSPTLCCFVCSFLNQSNNRIGKIYRLMQFKIIAQYCYTINIMLAGVSVRLQVFLTFVLHVDLLIVFCRMSFIFAYTFGMCSVKLYMFSTYVLFSMENSLSDGCGGGSAECNKETNNNASLNGNTCSL